MSENLHLVFSKPPEHISDEEYNRWYDFHLGEILVVPGFTAARRYRLQPVKGEWTPSGHRYLSAYELEGDPKDVMAELDTEVASGRMQLPDWFPQITHTHHQTGPAGAVRAAAKDKAALRRDSVVWSGTSMLRPSNVATERRSPSVCRHGRANASRSITPVSMARSE